MHVRMVSMLKYLCSGFVTSSTFTLQNNSKYKMTGNV
jgi:hypothetical protein